MAVTESAMESVSSKDSGLFCKTAVTESILVMLKTFPRDNSDRVCGSFFD